MPPSVTHGLPNGIETGHFQGWLYSGGAVGQSGSKRISIMRQNGDYKIYENVLNTGMWAGWKEIATATPPQEYDLSIDGSVFENYDNSIWLKSSYRKSQTGIVTVTIMGQFATDLHSDSDQTLATIPAGFRPKGYMRRIESTFAGSVAQIDVSNSGSIYVRGSAKANDWLCCELSFVASD